MEAQSLSGVDRAQAAPTAVAGGMMGLCPQGCPNPSHCDKTLRGKRDFARVIKLRTLRWGDSVDYPGGPNLITLVLKSGELSQLWSESGREMGRGRVGRETHCYQL